MCSYVRTLHDVLHMLNELFQISAPSENYFNLDLIAFPMNPPPASVYIPSQGTVEYMIGTGFNGWKGRGVYSLDKRRTGSSILQPTGRFCVYSLGR